MEEKKIYSRTNQEISQKKIKGSDGQKSVYYLLNEALRKLNQIRFEKQTKYSLYACITGYFEMPVKFIFSSKPLFQ